MPKRHGRFPNLAGFCRAIGIGVEVFEREMAAYPETFGMLCAIFEDEALNSDLSATVLAPYLKRRLGYGDKPEQQGSICDSAETRLVFQHDILEDGK